MSLLLHAIGPAPLAEPPAGLRGGTLSFISAGPVGAWATEIGEGAGDREDAFEHHRVVEALCARQPCLPIRFGSRVADPATAAALLAPRADALARALERVGGRRELAVTLLWTDAAVEPGRGHAPPPDRSGRAFLERKRAGHAAADERLALARDLARRLETELSADQADVRHALCPSAQVALSTAILAPAGRADATKEEAVKVAGRLTGVRAVVSGPWPPYTFADAS